MESIGSNVNAAEQFLTLYIKNNFTFLDLGDPVILPKQDSSEKEFIGVLLTTSTPMALDGIELNYSIVFRMASHRATLFDDRNKIIDINRAFDTDIENLLESEPQKDIFAIDRNGDITYEITDDWYDVIFPVMILV